jgi:hypothetical protein
LLKVELDLADDQADDGKLDQQRLGGWRTAITNALTQATSAGNPQKDLLDYGRFLRVWIDVESGRALQSADKDLLLNWPDSAASQTPVAWQTPRRAAQATDLLVRLADAELPAKDKSDILGLPSSGQKFAAAREYLAKAERLGGAAPYFQGLMSIVLAASPPQPAPDEYWVKVADSSARALADAGARTRLAKRTPLVEYAGALATARRAARAAESANRSALAVFGTLLSDQEIFRDAGPDHSNDRDVLESIVVPALSIPLPAQPADDDRRYMASVWGAEARLIERNVSFAGLEGVAAASHADSYARAILTANTAYEKARQLHEQPLYAAGYGRTLLELPREDFYANWDRNYQSLSTLIDRYDAQGSSDDANLLFIGAWVMFRRAFDASDRPEQMKRIVDSLRRYDKLAELTATADPYRLRSMALGMASNAHVRAAFWTPIRSADEVRNPPAESKYKYLQRAVALAEQAEMEEGRRKPEEALISKGNGLEDLAWYCKLTENYPKAVAAFETAESLYGPLRSSAYAITCRGRCQYRWATDALDIEADPDLKRTKLREARASLETAVNKAGPDEPQAKAEAKWWLGYTLKALAASERDVSARLAMLDQARKEMAGAADLVKSGAKADWAIYASDCARETLSLGLQLTDAAKLPGVTREALLGDAAARADALLELAKNEPGLVGPDRAALAVNILIKARETAGRQRAIEVLQQWEPFFNKSDDAWRAALVELLFWKAEYQEGARKEEEITRAENIANQMSDSPAKDRAIGLSRRHKADFIYQTKLEKLIKDKQGDKADAALLDQVIALYMESESRLARAVDPKTAANLAALKGAKLLDVESGNFERKQGLTKLEAQRLRNFILELDRTHKIRTNAILVLTERLKRFNELTSDKLGTPFTPAAAAVARPLHDLIKPFSYMGKGALDPTSRTYVEVLERKLGI